MPQGASRRRFLCCFPLGALGIAATACGFTPVHGPGAATAPGGGKSRIEVDVLPGAEGFALRERLVERLGAPATPTHRLAVELSVREEGAAITDDDITTRFLVLGTATFELIPIGSANPIFSGTVSGRTGYSAPVGELASAYATRVAALAARKRVAHTLANRIALRIAAAEWAAGAPEPAAPGL